MYQVRLQRTDGSPADPPTYRSSTLNWRQGDKIPLTASGRCAFSAFATTTRISRPHWSLRTCPDRALAPPAETP